MSSKRSIAAYVLLLACLVLASIQGQRIQDIRDSTTFYRWIMSASVTKLRDEPLLTGAETNRGSVDDAFYDEISTRSNSSMPDTFTSELETDYDDNGLTRSSLLRHVARSNDQEIWKFASNAANDDLRDAFKNHVREGELVSVGSLADINTLYAGDSTVDGVGVTSMFLGFRQLAANFIWLQVDKYWHEGQVHRMVPLMRTCVTLDPHFIDAYLVGAWHMAYNITASMDNTPERDKKVHPKYGKRLGPKEEWYYIAIDYLRDGIRKNPRDYRLYFDLGYQIYEVKLKDHANAVRYLREARKYRHERWVPRMLFRALTLNGQYEESIEGWNEYLEFFPDSDTARIAIKENEAYLAEALYDEYIECANAARNEAKRLRDEAKAAGANGDTERAEALLAESEKVRVDLQELAIAAQVQRDGAIQMWSVLERDEGSTLATARIRRMAALDAVNEGRYIEAVAELEAARWTHPLFFDEATDMILDISLEHDLLLDVSLQRAVERRNEDAKYLTADSLPPVIRRVDCDYRETSEGAV